MRPRWQRGVDLTSAALGEAVGKLYVERYFPAETKAKVQAMVSDIVKAFAKRIDALAWMSPETKAKAKGSWDAQGRRRLSRPVARLLRTRNRQGRRARQCASAPSCSSITASSRSSSSRSTAANGG